MGKKGKNGVRKMKGKTNEKQMPKENMLNIYFSRDNSSTDLTLNNSGTDPTRQETQDPSEE